LRRAILGALGLIGMGLFILFSGTASATPAASIQNISYNAGTSTLSWQVVLTNDATAVTNAAVAFAAPAGSTATSTTGTGSCVGLPAATPITCSIPASGNLTINFSRVIQTICTSQGITLGPVTITGGGVVGTVTVPRTLATIPAGSVCSTGVPTTATYNAATQAVDWVIPTFASPNGQTTYQFIGGQSDRNCFFLISFPAICGNTGAAPALTDVTTRITAASPAGICGTLPATVPPTTLYVCTIPTGSPAGSITLSLSMPQQCTEYIGALPGYIFQQPGGVLTLTIGGYVAVPADLAACVVATPPVVPTPSVNATATPIPTVVPVIVAPPVIPQVFQNPALGGIFNGTRNNTPTPVRAAAVAPNAGGPPPAAMPVLRPPSTGNAGLALVWD